MNWIYSFKRFLHSHQFMYPMSKSIELKLHYDGARWTINFPAEMKIKPVSIEKMR